VKAGLHLLTRALLIGLLAPLLACPSEPAGPPNILLVTFCSLRADRLGAYGYERETSPHFDALAADGVRFDSAYANGTWTNSAHGAILSGLYPGLHGLMHEGQSLAEVPTIPGVLKLYGYRVAADIQEPGPASIGGGHGLVRDFDEVWTTDWHKDWRPGPVADWAAGEESPYMALVHLREAHYPYGDGPPFTDTVDERITAWINGNKPGMNRTDKKKAAPSRHDGYATFLWELGRDDTLRQNFDAVYDSGVWEADRSLGRLLDAFESRELLDNTVIILVAGHGEELGHGGNLGHKVSFAREVTRVPLIMKLPGVSGGRVIADDVSQVDLLPTILELADAVPPASMSGRSLVPLLEGEPLAPRSALTQRVSGQETLVLENLLTEGHWRLVHVGGIPTLERLYPSGNMSRDLKGQPKRLEAMQATAAELAAGSSVDPEPPGISEQLKEELRRRGYW